VSRARANVCTLLLALGAVGTGCATVRPQTPFIPARCIQEVRFDGARCVHVEGDRYRCSQVTLRASCVLYLPKAKEPKP